MPDRRPPPGPTRPAGALPDPFTAPGKPNPGGNPADATNVTISGIGGAVPPLRPSGPAAAAPTRTGNDFDSLTDSDRELIFQATGQRIDPGFDPHEQPTSMFAAVIAGARAYGRLSPGQDVTAAFLIGESRRYDAAGTGGNPIAPFLDRAVAYLQARPGPRVDVNA